MESPTIDPLAGPFAGPLGQHPEVRALLRTARHGLAPHADGVLSWRAWGEGQPVLLLHGSHGGWPHWIRTIAPLARDRHVVAVDMPGFGESDPPADIENAHDHAELIAGALAQMDESGAAWDLVGFSLGAMVALMIAVRHPERVRRVILVDAGGLGTPMRFADFRGMKGLDPAQRRAVNRHNLGAMMLHDPASIDDLAVDIAATYGPLSRTRMQYHVIPDKTLDGLRQTRPPVDLIWGEHDFPHPDPAANAAAVRRYHPAAELRVVPGAGHWAMYERPEAFNAALRELLAMPVRPPVDL